MGVGVGVGVVLVALAVGTVAVLRNRKHDSRSLDTPARPGPGYQGNNSPPLKPVALEMTSRSAAGTPDSSVARMEASFTISQPLPDGQLGSRGVATFV